MDAIELLLTRQSDAKLTAPGPNSEQLDIIKQAALRVPDHGCMRLGSLLSFKVMPAIN